MLFILKSAFLSYKSSFIKGWQIVYKQKRELQLKSMVFFISEKTRLNEMKVLCQTHTQHKMLEFAAKQN